MIAGVDFDQAHPAVGDAGAVSPTTLPDGAVVGVGADGGPLTSACTPDPSSVTCADRCGVVDDNCKGPRTCPASCGFGRLCTNGKCECVADGTWCKNRCGDTTDNCG